MKSKNMYINTNKHGDRGIPSGNLKFFCAIGFPAFRRKWYTYVFKLGISINGKTQELPAVIDIYLGFHTIIIFIGKKNNSGY